MGNTVLFSSKTGDVVLPISPGSTLGSAVLDNTVIGATTPVAATVTTLTTTGAAVVASTLTVNGNSVTGPNAISAGTLAAGTTGAHAVITAAITNVSTAGASNIYVDLPVAVAGYQYLVYNSGAASAQTINVSPNGSDTIDGANSAVTITVAHRAAWFYGIAANKWISALVGAVAT